MVAVEAIRSKKDITKLKEYFLSKQKLRNYMIFVLGSGIGLRSIDLLKLKVSTVKGKTKFRVIEQKTKKERLVILPIWLKKELTLYIKDMGLEDDDFLFQSQKGGHLKTKQARMILKKAARECNLDINLGMHSLRKTWGHRMFVAGGRDIYLVSKAMNHETIFECLKYIGLTEKRVQNLQKNIKF
jgi:site-specific recombinase XerD